MIRSIIDFFNGIATYLQSIGQFITNAVTGLVDVVRILLSFLAKVPDYFSWLPDEFILIVVTTFGVAVMYKILGREG